MSMQPPAPPPGGGDRPGWGGSEGQWGAYGGQHQPPPGYQVPPAYGQYSYGQPSSPYGNREHPQGTTILVLGILSLVVCGLLGPVAWSMGSKALKEIDSSPGNYTNRGSVNAGKICGMIASILLIIGLGIALVAILAAVSTS